MGGRAGYTLQSFCPTHTHHSAKRISAAIPAAGGFSEGTSVTLAPEAGILLLGGAPIINKYVFIFDAKDNSKLREP